MLIRYYFEDKRRLLVYEYICNGSLESHLYGSGLKVLGWLNLHFAISPKCPTKYKAKTHGCIPGPVGCIVHQDMHPNNILVTRDFKRMVGDFSLARWQPDGDLAMETRVISTYGYLAPKYAQNGKITEKADVYSFRVVLVELVTGCDTMDINRPKGQ
eukprot:Gb_31476 [translate_table: standard]